MKLKDVLKKAEGKHEQRKSTQAELVSAGEQDHEAEAEQVRVNRAEFFEDQTVHLRGIVDSLEGMILDKKDDGQKTPTAIKISTEIGEESLILKLTSVSQKNEENGPEWQDITGTPIAKVGVYIEEEAALLTINPEAWQAEIGYVYGPYGSKSNKEYQAKRVMNEPLRIAEDGNEQDAYARSEEEILELILEDILPQHLSLEAMDQVFSTLSKVEIKPAGLTAKPA